MSDPSFLLKLAPRDDVVRRAAALPAPMVFTNGVFDVLHRGHAAYLAQARDLGASLVVAINTDDSARRLGKGNGRPLNNQQDRAALVAALGAVSLVTWFDEDAPLVLLQQLRPQYYVKGGDYDVKRLRETELIQSWGGKALAIPFLAGYSTTALVERIRQA